MVDGKKPATKWNVTLFVYSSNPMSNEELNNYGKFIYNTFVLNCCLFTVILIAGNPFGYFKKYISQTFFGQCVLVCIITTSSRKLEVLVKILQKY